MRGVGGAGMGKGKKRGLGTTLGAQPFSALIIYTFNMVDIQAVNSIIFMIGNHLNAPSFYARC
jgi:hypothetical protein